MQCLKQGRVYSDTIGVNYYYHLIKLFLLAVGRFGAEIPTRRKGSLPSTRLQFEHSNGHFHLEPVVSSFECLHSLDGLLFWVCLGDTCLA